MREFEFSGRVAGGTPRSSCSAAGRAEGASAGRDQVFATVGRRLAGRSTRVSKLANDLGDLSVPLLNAARIHRPYVSVCSRSDVRVVLDLSRMGERRQQAQPE